MALINVNNRNLATYLSGGNFGLTRGIIINGTSSYLHIRYIDRDDLCIGQGDAASPVPAFSMRWDPSLVNSTGSNVGTFNSPVSDAFNASYLMGDFVPATNQQRLFNVLSASGVIQEVSINDPSSLINSNPWPKFQRNIPFDFVSGQVGYWNGPEEWIFFPGIDMGICMRAQCWIDQGGPTVKTDLIVAVTLSTGFGEPLGVPLLYKAGGNEFNRGPVFDESEIRFRSLQFLPDDNSASGEPKGQLFFWSETTNPSGNIGRVYVKFVDFNPTDAPGTPSRIHLRETLFSRVNLTLNTVPSGDPPTPIDGIPTSAFEIKHPNVFFATFGDKRIHIYGTDGIGVGDGNQIDVQAANAAQPAVISTPSQKTDPITNQVVTYQTEVTGDLGEEINAAEVTWSLERLSTEGEVLATTPTPGETVVVENFPIDRSIEFGAGFAVREDGVALTEGGGSDYTVTAATGSINFVAPKPLAGGEVYTADYAHTEDPATPPHGTLLDTEVLTTIDGVAQGRISYPDDDDLAGHLDHIVADTPT